MSAGVITVYADLLDIPGQRARATATATAATASSGIVDIAQCLACCGHSL